jgi:hypothetical protein
MQAVDVFNSFDGEFIIDGFVLLLIYIYILVYKV